jgi:hypothetical protein
LKRELAAYSTPAQRCDLEAILDEYPDEDTSELRAIPRVKLWLPIPKGLLARDGTETSVQGRQLRG